MDDTDLQVPMASRLWLFLVLATMVVVGGGIGWATSRWVNRVELNGTHSSRTNPASPRATHHGAIVASAHHHHRAQPAAAAETRYVLIAKPSGAPSAAHHYHHAAHRALAMHRHGAAHHAHHGRATAHRGGVHHGPNAMGLSDGAVAQTHCAG